jgi:hypothetical protein
MRGIRILIHISMPDTFANATFLMGMGFFVLALTNFTNHESRLTVIGEHQNNLKMRRVNE